ncbi:MAG TPA: hypothetical protein VHL08_05425 [Dongiaceae bacterium]|nr:hypothetical protein [Dongiaceae bacterium]
MKNPINPVNGDKDRPVPQQSVQQLAVEIDGETVIFDVRNPFDMSETLGGASIASIPDEAAAFGISAVITAPVERTDTDIADALADADPNNADLDIAPAEGALGGGQGPGGRLLFVPFEDSAIVPASLRAVGILDLQELTLRGFSPSIAEGASSPSSVAGPDSSLPQIDTVAVTGGTTDPGSGDGGTTDPGTDGGGTTDTGTGGGGATDPSTGGGGTTDPGTDGGGTTEPGTDGGGTTDPGTGGTTDPGTGGGGTTDPGTGGGGTTDPGTGGGGTTDTGTGSGGTTDPNTSGDGTTDTGTGGGDTTDPGTGGGGTTDSGTGGTTDPGTGGGDTTDTGTGSGGTMDPSTGGGGTTDPGTGGGGTTDPGTGGGGTTDPGTGNGGTTDPSTGGGTTDPGGGTSPPPSPPAPSGPPPVFVGVTANSHYIVNESGLAWGSNPVSDTIPTGTSNALHADGQLAFTTDSSGGEISSVVLRTNEVHSGAALGGSAVINSQGNAYVVHGYDDNHVHYWDLTIDKTTGAYDFHLVNNTLSNNVTAWHAQRYVELDVQVTDHEGQTSNTGTIAFTILDDDIFARDDLATLLSGHSGDSITGNVILGINTIADSSNPYDKVAGSRDTADKVSIDVLGADGGGVGHYWVTNTASPLNDSVGPGHWLQGTYGKLTIGHDGTFTYQLTKDVAIAVDDVFTYNLIDGDGDGNGDSRAGIAQFSPDHSIATLHIHIAPPLPDPNA